MTNKKFKFYTYFQNQNMMVVIVAIILMIIKEISLLILSIVL